MIQIDSDMLIPTENHFRVSAGPGAGKTHWLVNHINNVLHTSERLGKSRKIACITYTNIAVETILSRLGMSAGQVEVSTIHSFLYNHIVKPYISAIGPEFDVDVQKIDGHDDVVLSNYNFLYDWKGRTRQQRIRSDGQLVEAIRAARWRFDDTGKLIIRPDYPRRVDGYPIANNSYAEYKKMAWQKGVIHHDDVLFFSYQLLMKTPFILRVLRAKFPYFFVDEFQDTNPIQTSILEQIGQDETIIGIIGDKAQSIFGFQGAAPEQFSSFALPNMIDYQMPGNRRSTNQIIDLLNATRSDIQQVKTQDREGEKPVIIIGDKVGVLRNIQEICDDDVCSLSRDNITSNAMKASLSKNIPPSDLLLSLAGIDSNSDRRKLIIACIKAMELARQSHFKEAIKELERRFRDNGDKNKSRGEALKHLSFLLRNYAKIKHVSLLDFHAFIKDNVKPVSDLRSGAIRTFYESHTYQQLAVCVKIAEDGSLHRTIHKAKGAGFNNVLLVLKDDQDLDFLFNPDLDNKEEHRINYVAISRAKKRLFITLPSLSVATRTALEPLSSLFEFIDCA